MNKANNAHFDFAPSPFKRVLAWHYSPASSMEGIIGSGALMPTITGDFEQPWQHPVLFFTEGELPGGAVGFSNYLRHKSLVWLRYGYSGPAIVPAKQFLFLYRKFLWQRRPACEEVLVSESETANRWWVSFRPILIDELSIIQASDDGGQSWRTIFTNPDRAAGVSAQSIH